MAAVALLSPGFFESFVWRCRPRSVTAVRFNRPRSPRSASGTLAGTSDRRVVIDAKRDEITEVVREHRGRTVALFGPVARADNTAASDVDFLVEFDPGSSLFYLLHLQDDLEALLGCSVDVVPTRGLYSSRVTSTSAPRPSLCEPLGRSAPSRPGESVTAGSSQPGDARREPRHSRRREAVEDLPAGQRLPQRRAHRVDDVNHLLGVTAH